MPVHLIRMGNTFSLSEKDQGLKYIIIPQESRLKRNPKIMKVHKQAQR